MIVIVVVIIFVNIIVDDNDEHNNKNYLTIMPLTPRRTSPKHPCGACFALTFDSALRNATLALKTSRSTGLGWHRINWYMIWSSSNQINSVRFTKSMNPSIHQSKKRSQRSNYSKKYEFFHSWWFNSANHTFCIWNQRNKPPPSSGATPYRNRGGHERWATNFTTSRYDKVLQGGMTWRKEVSLSNFSGYGQISCS